MPITQGPGLSQGNAINVRPAAHANQLHVEGSDTVTSTSFEEIFSYAATAIDDNTRVYQIEANASTFGHYRVKINGTTIREQYTTGAYPNAHFVFMEVRTLANGDILTVEFAAYRFLTGIVSHTTFTALEGYIGT